MTDIDKNIRILKDQVPVSVKVVAVSKTMPVEHIMAAYSTGHRIFGENRVHELLSKKDHLPSDIEWHMIGHLQSKKAKQIIPFVRMIQSVDSQKLLNVINRESEKLGLVTDCLLQFHIAREESKFGFTFEDAVRMFESTDFMNFHNIRICGVMGMATFTDDETAVRKEFIDLREIFTLLKNKYFLNDPSFSEISMGMSGDYKIAIEEGSTIIRIGSIIFGDRI